MNDKELALKIIELTGSKENISSVRHCATRLRLVVKNKDKINYFTKNQENPYLFKERYTSDGRVSYK